MPDLTEKPADKLSPEMLLMLQAAHQGLQVAQVRFDHACETINSIYKIGEGDVVDAVTGTITRESLTARPTDSPSKE